MTKAYRFTTLITAVMIMFGLFGCTNNAQFDIKTYQNAEKDTMLLDYYEQTVGTPMKQPYYELVLYTYSDTQATLEEIENGGMDDETITRYLIPIEGAQEMLTAVKKSGMARWNSREGIAICGRSNVCKFPDGNGGYTRVTSGNMPEDGSRIFGEIKIAMRKWISKGTVVTEP